MIRRSGRIGRLPALYLTVMLLALPLRASAAEDVILVLGDSLSAAYGMAQSDGWVALLERRLERKGYAYRVVNASISGETTGGGLRRLPILLERHRPSVVIVELGANDGLRGQPLKGMRSNLESIIEMSQEAGAKALLLGMHLPPNYGADYAAEFHQSFEEVARANDAALLPFFLDGVALKRELFQEDGIHPNPAAQKRLLNNVWPQLRPLLKAAEAVPDAAAAGQGVVARALVPTVWRRPIAWPGAVRPA